MAVKNFAIRENWVGSKLNGLKTTFFAIFDTTWSQKSQMNNSFNSFLVTKVRNHIISNFVTWRLTKVKFLKIISFFSIFDPN